MNLCFHLANRAITTECRGIAEPTVLLPWLNGRSNWVYRVSKRECISIL